jgi:hypothetical protein
VSVVEHVKTNKWDWSRSRAAQLVFFGNYFYGLCAVALSVEAALQQERPLNEWLYYALSFAVTVVYYTKAYVTSNPHHGTSKRSAWYYKHRVLVRNSQWFFAAFIFVGGFVYVYRHFNALVGLPLAHWLLVALFPAVALLYYGIDNTKFGAVNLRRVGWLKPFIIGFAWAGLVTVYPVVFGGVERGDVYTPTLIGALLFLKNFMFISVLCIMFDVKDYATDHNVQLKTFVVEFGLRKTIFYILLPLCVLGLGSFIVYGLVRDFSTMKILINTVPFVALISVAYSLQRRKTIFYYLVIIDGLMLVKAACGITAMLFF